MTYRKAGPAFLGLLLLWTMTAPVATAQPLTPSLLDGLHFRSIGPAVTGGRIHDVEALPDDPATLYVATASGGLWKSVNKGTTWQPLFDDQPVSTFGDVALAPSNPDVVWAGTGEQQNRQSTSWGNGVYRSTDGGRTWTHRGLDETRHIARVRVHPQDPDVAYVAAPGNLWKASEARGVYKTTDGGASWERVLYVDSLTGVIDLAMDPQAPGTLYAAAYQRLRRAWGFNGGGPGSGLYKTTDGGATWTELTNGLPEGDKGRIGLALAASNPQVLYAIVEHADSSGVFRTDDGGASWRRVNRLNPRPMYYSHVVADPTDEDRVYVLAVEFYRSDDGGTTFRQMPTRPTYDVGIHSDHHALWIDPHDPEHFYLGGDGGLSESWDRGETYARIDNLPIGQFYAIGLDQRDPYFVYGGMQDNHSWMGPSASRRWIGILHDDWRQVGFGDGMYQQPDPTNHRFSYILAQNGTILRLDAETGDLLDVEPAPPEGEKAYRFDWVTPALVSQHDPQTVYLGGNRLFISRNRGVSWQRTEDLTRQIERDSLFLMGVQGKQKMLSKNDGTSSFGEITTLAESPLDGRILWVGTDDGNVQVSRDGGATWTNVAAHLAGVPEGTYVSRVVASAQAPGTAYAALDAHRDGDFRPYVFKTTDFGQTWTPRTEGLPADGSVNVLVEHPDDPDLLFLGTEHALFVSTTAGRAWTRFRANLPTTLYDDLKIHPRENDLVVGTHGRSLWILDDLAPLVEWSPQVQAAAAHLFSIRTARLHGYWKATSYRGQAFYAGENPPFGALLTYHLAAPADTAQITFRNARGEVVRQLGGPATAGVLHRLAWDLRHAPPPFRDDDEPTEGLVKSEKILPELPRPVDPVGPLVSPGLYTVTLEAGGAVAVQTVQVEGDPEMALTQAQWEDREAFLVGLLALQRQAWDAAERAAALQKTLAAERDSLKKLGDVPEALAAQADSAQARARRLRSVRGNLYGLAGAFNGRGVRQGSLYPPTETHRQRRQDLEARLRREMTGLETFIEQTGRAVVVGGR